MSFIIHVTDKKGSETIQKEGIRCGSYGDKHPLGGDCTVFSYPLDGIGDEIEYWPQNAKLRGVDVDDGVYIIAEVDDKNCQVGDLRREPPMHLHPDQYQKAIDDYMKVVTSLSEYYENGLKDNYSEPEVVCNGSIGPKKIKAVLTHSEIKPLWDKCKDKRNSAECIITMIDNLLTSESVTH